MNKKILAATSVSVILLIGLTIGIVLYVESCPDYVPNACKYVQPATVTKVYVEQNVPFYNPVFKFQLTHKFKGHDVCYLVDQYQELMYPTEPFFYKWGLGQEYYMYTSMSKDGDYVVCDYNLAKTADRWLAGKILVMVNGGILILVLGGYSAYILSKNRRRRNRYQQIE